MLDDIDSNLWVLEPERPSRADLLRRVALGVVSVPLSLFLSLTVHSLPS